jgi:hypothetical protein
MLSPRSGNVQVDCVERALREVDGDVNVERTVGVETPLAPCSGAATCA